jgi:hypothetical protein
VELLDDNPTTITQQQQQQHQGCRKASSSSSSPILDHVVDAAFKLGTNKLDHCPQVWPWPHRRSYRRCGLSRVKELARSIQP